jgi:hypothetical protein
MGVVRPECLPPTSRTSGQGLRLPVRVSIMSVCARASLRIVLSRLVPQLGRQSERSVFRALGQRQMTGNCATQCITSSCFCKDARQVTTTWMDRADQHTLLCAGPTCLYLSNAKQSILKTFTAPRGLRRGIRGQRGDATLTLASRGVPL